MINSPSYCYRCGKNKNKTYEVNSLPKETYNMAIKQNR